MSRFETAGELAKRPQPPTIEDVTSPVRPPSVHSDVLVPLGQAIVSGLFIGIAGATAARLLFNLDWSIVEPLGILLFASVAAGTWFWRMGWASSTIERLEQRTGVDLDGDGQVGLAPHAYTVNRTQQPKRDAIEQEKARLAEFVAMIYQHGTDIRTLRTRFADGEIARFRALLTRPGVNVAAWINPRNRNQGWRPIVSYEQAVEIIGQLQWSTTGRSELDE